MTNTKCQGSGLWRRPGAWDRPCPRNASVTVSDLRSVRNEDGRGFHGEWSEPRQICSRCAEQEVDGAFTVMVDADGNRQRGKRYEV